MLPSLLVVGVFAWHLDFPARSGSICDKLPRDQSREQQVHGAGAEDVGGRNGKDWEQDSTTEAGGVLGAGRGIDSVDNRDGMLAVPS